ncbi:hypothetical protein FACS1894189_2180 [Planctomycetales bacterium]|nr:hypothetical protein FACS1894189_2180 [Planctomycetales bacterium]
MSIPNFSPIMPSAMQDAKVHERTVDASNRAVQAQGVGGDDKESEAASGDRDADGRQAWQWNRHQGKQKDEKEHKVQDISGKSGTTLDLDG